jgi:hypothetical protein
VLLCFSDDGHQMIYLSLFHLRIYKYVRVRQKWKISQTIIITHSLCNIISPHLVASLSSLTMVRLSALAAAALLPFTASAFSVSDASVSRREAFAKTATTLIGGSIAGSLVGVPSSAVAIVTDETPKVISRMGGLLVRPMQTYPVYNNSSML